MSTEQNKIVARQLIEEIFNQGNISLIDEILATDFIEHEELPPGMPSGREGIKLATTMLRSAFPDFKATIEDVVVEGDKVAFRLTWSGTHEGEFMDMPPTGKSFSIAVFDILRITGGRIVEHWGLMDNMSMMQQLGAMPAPE